MSLISMCQNYATRFRNMPVDKAGNQILFRDFRHMVKDELLIWRDHLLNSFQERAEGDAPYDRAFQFLTFTGNEPSLTMLCMGKTEKKSKKEAKPKVSKRKSQKALGGKAKAAKGTRKSKKDTESSAEETEDEEVDKDEEEVEREVEVEQEHQEHQEQEQREQDENMEEKAVHGNPSKPPRKVPRPKPRPRQASEKAKPIIASHIEQDNQDELETQQAKKDALRISNPTGPAPGEETSLQKAQFHGTRAVPGRDGEVSFYLQRPHAMRNSTLPEDWKVKGFDKAKVKSVLNRHKDGVGDERRRVG
jgi:hypothetical protein